MLRRLHGFLVLVAALVLGACGGGGGDTPAEVGAQLASAPMAAVDLSKCDKAGAAYQLVNGQCIASFSGIQVQPQAALPAQSAQRPLSAALPQRSLDRYGLFDWAPTRYPQFFSGSYFDDSIYIAGFGTFYYRYYYSGNFLAVLDGTVYVYGPMTDYTIYYVGALTDFTCYVYDCGGGSGGSLSVGSSVSSGFYSAGGYTDHTIYLSAGTSYTFNLVGGSLADPYLELYNPYGTPVANDDDSGDGLNSRIVHTASYSATYTLRAKSYGSGYGSYTLGAAYTSGGGGGTGGTGGTVDWSSSFSAAEIVELSPTLAVNQRSGQGFTVTGGALPVEIIFAAQYTADLYITTGDGLNACVNGGSFSYFPEYSFQGQFGYQSFSLPEGSYGVCLVNRANTTNALRVEFQNQPTVTGFHYLQQRFDTVTRTVAAGGRITQPATVGDNYRVIVDGANSGGTFYTLPASEQSNFLNGSSFQYYTSIDCSSGRAAPGLCELTGVGDYVIGYVNDTSSPQAIVIIGRDYVPD